MNIKYCFFVSIILYLNLLQAVENSTLSNEAVIECGNIHHIELQNFPQANASFSNGKCRLTCWIGNTILATDSIYEGRSCPEDSNGICRAGQCIGGQDEALNECGLKHNLDFLKMKDHQGTSFTNDQCMLKCVLDGTELSTNPINEGLPCPTNPNGVCRNGACMSQSTNPGTTVTPTTVHTIQPTTQIPFSPSQIKFLNISLVATTPPLNRTQNIRTYYHYKFINSGYTMAIFHGDPTIPTEYHSKTIQDIPKDLIPASQIGLNLWQNGYPVVDKYANLYSLFENFYRNPQFGDHDNFLANFTISPKANPNEVLFEVQLRFTIVFSKH